MFNIILILMLIGLPGHCEDLKYIDFNTGEFVIQKKVNDNSNIYVDLNSGELKIQDIKDGFKYDYSDPDESGLILEVE